LKNKIFRSAKLKIKNLRVKFFNLKKKKKKKNLGTWRTCPYWLVWCEHRQIVLTNFESEYLLELFEYRSKQINETRPFILSPLIFFTNYQKLATILYITSWIDRSFFVRDILGLHEYRIETKHLLRPPNWPPETI